MDKFDLRSATLAEIKSHIADIGEKPFRGEQIFRWLNQKHVSDLDEMTNISNALREKLRQSASVSAVKVLKSIASDSGDAIKYLFELENNCIMYSEEKKVTVEAVLMRYLHGSAVCVSSQAGCRMGCAFCASGIGGLDRNLTAGEMLAQVYAASNDLENRKSVSNVTIMGCGEPLDNYDNVLRFIGILNCPEGLGLGQRRITLSTCGLTDKIYRLIDEKLQITLAVSIHAPNDEIRNRILPVSLKYPMNELLKACRCYANETKRRVTFEYVLIAGINDAPEHASELAKKLRHMLCHVNLIPANASSIVQERSSSGLRKPGAGQKFAPASPETVANFKDILTGAGIETTVRRRLGGGINAACGQLRHNAAMTGEYNA